MNQHKLDLRLLESALSAIREETGLRKHEVLELAGFTPAMSLPDLLRRLRSPPFIKVLAEAERPSVNPYRLRAEIAKQFGVELNQIHISPETGEIQIIRMKKSVLSHIKVMAKLRKRHAA